MSSDFLWQPTDLSRFDLVYAGAQKNIGPSGVVVVILRKDWMAAGNTSIPNIFRYGVHGAKNSLLNTPPTFSIYMIRNVLRVLKAKGGLASARQRNQAKASRLYGVIEAHPDFYHCPVAPKDRSAMNVVWRLGDEALEGQGFPAAKFKAIARKYSNSLEQDLGGNAYGYPVVSALLHCFLFNTEFVDDAGPISSTTQEVECCD